jgi:signal peptidase I
MRSRIFLVIVAIIILAAAAFYMSEQPHEVDVTIKTNGTELSVQGLSSFIFFPVPGEMLSKMRDKAQIDVQSDASTVSSVKADMKAIAAEYNYSADVKIDSQFGTDQLPMPATVSGTSMVPTLQDGQSITVLKTTDFKVGDIVVARHPTYNLIVKRVAEINDTQVYLKSDNREVTVIGNTIYKGLDTWLPKENVIGVVKIY